MAVYKFKITFEEYDDVNRVIEIKSTQTFLDLHKAILQSINFDTKQLASFYMSNDSWQKGQEITLEDMSEGEEEKTPIMKAAKLNAYIVDPHQKILYVYDLIDVWVFNIELVGIEAKEKAGVKYPVCSKTVGIAPKQYDKIKRFGLVDDNEFDEITKNYLDISDEVPGEISDDEDGEFGLSDEQGEASGGDEEEM